jgi:peroxin-2
LKTRYAPELALIIKIVLYKFSVWDWGASYGARLQGLTYRLPRRLPRTGVLALHALLTILVPYAHNRLRGHALSYAWPDAPSTDRRRKLWDLLGRLEFVHTFSALVNFLAFLRYGRQVFSALNLIYI